MYLFGSGLTKHRNDAVAGRTTDNGVIDHDNALACNSLAQDIQLDLYAGFTAALFRLDKGTADIAVLYKGHTIGDPGLQCISHGCGITGFRYTDHKIRIHRRIHGEIFSRKHTGIVNAHPVDLAVKTGKINIFKDTAGLLLFRDTHRLVGLDAAVFGDRNHLARLHIADKGRSDSIERTGLRCQNIGIVAFADTQRTETIRITHTHELSRGCNHQRVCTFQLLCRTDHSFFRRLCLDTFSCDMIGNNLRIDRCLENSTADLQLMTELRCIDQIAIVRQRQCTFNIIQNQRLRIFTGRCSCSGVTDMSHTDITIELFQIFRRKDLVDKPHALMRLYYVRTVGITDGDTTAFLTTVLQGHQAIINR